jgi:hypothetical protein
MQAMEYLGKIPEKLLYLQKVFICIKVALVFQYSGDEYLQDSLDLTV